MSLLKMHRPDWTLAILTLPSREEYLGRLVQSIAATVDPSRAEVLILRNDGPEPLAADARARLESLAGTLSLRFLPGHADPTIPRGRNALLAACRTARICFLDDDVTVHGDLLRSLDDALAAEPLALVGLPSFENASDKLHKPRPDTPAVAQASVRWMPVHGLLCAGYTEVLQQAGGFRERRRFWGEWTELNLRLWRMGLPTGYWMKGAHVRHWTAAPDSPTRNRAHKEREIVWGLLCTALEYDAGVDTPGSEAFWRLIASRYLPYAFGRGLSAESVFAVIVELLPSLGAEWRAIEADRKRARRHPFDFRPFQPLSLRQVASVRRHARRALRRVRAAAGALAPDLEISLGMLPAPI
jgi:GT2 family glycosyltransferase